MTTDLGFIGPDGDPAHTYDEVVQTVAQLLPFDVILDADMGYTGALFIDLGRRGGEDDPPDTASLDSEVQPVVWGFDVQGGQETVMSDFGPAADPVEVAHWIVYQACRVQSPAARQWMQSPEGEVVPRDDQ